MKKIINNENGFFAITEVIVVISVAMILMGLAIPTFRSARERARETQAISDMGNIIRPSIEMFKQDMRRYPATTDGPGYSLITKYTSLSPYPELWKGPYLQGTAWPIDPWGNPYLLVGDGYTLSMLVSYGKNQTADYSYSGNPSARPSIKDGRFCSQMGDDCSVKDDLGVVVYDGN